jgi:hypothetical protein
MDNQTEVPLADALEMSVKTKIAAGLNDSTTEQELEAATELRRLSDIEKAYDSICDMIYKQNKKLKEIEAEKAELLEALKALCTHAPRSSQQIEADWNKARAAIAKAEGEQK